MKTEETKSETVFQNQHQSLIDGCKNGDQKAQFQIYKLYYKAMYYTSLQIVKNKMEAEDIMQESFLAAFDSLDSFSGTVSFGAWLKKIVYNRSLDYIRKSSRLVFEDLEYCSDLEEGCSDVDNEREDAERKVNKVKEVITTLPSKCRKVLSLYLLEGYDHEEIGDILSISTSTSRSQYSRGRDRIIREFRKGQEC
jgi:RNA polymerase sigma-70 factor (ECF subfamily)